MRRCLNTVNTEVRSMYNFGEYFWQGVFGLIILMALSLLATLLYLLHPVVLMVVASALILIVVQAFIRCIIWEIKHSRKRK